MSQKLLAISSVVGVGDPIFDNLGNGGKKMISGLGMDLAARRRVKLFGTVDEAMRRVGDGKVQMVIEIEQSLGMFCSWTSGTN